MDRSSLTCSTSASRASLNFRWIDPCSMRRSRGGCREECLLRTLLAASLQRLDHLYVTNLTGSRVTQMTFSAKPYEHAGLSSDRRYIAANRLANGISSLWIIDLKNRTEAQLVPEHRDSGGGGMDWSPDGFIFFSSAVVSGGDKNIYKIKPDGT